MAGAEPNSPSTAGAAAATPKLKAVDGVADVTGPRDANENKGASAAGAAEAGAAAAGCVNPPNENEGTAEMERNSPPATGAVLATPKAKSSGWGSRRSSRGPKAEG